MNAPHDGDEEPPVKPPSPVKLRWWMACFISAIVISPIVSVVLGLYLPNQHFRDNQEGARSGFIGRTIQFEVVLIAVDPIEGVMTLDWNIIGEKQSPCSPTNLTACTSVNIFFDGNLIRQGSTNGDVSSSDRPTKPVFRHNATGFVLKDVMNNSPTFRTQVALFSPGYTASSLLYYPFDRYSAELFLFAQDAVTNNSVGVVFEKTRGIAVGFTTEVVSRTDAYIPPGVIDVYIILSRGRFVKLYAIAATLTVWMITLTLLVVTVTSVFFGFRQKGEILVVPVATLFAFTQLRSSMPGAPEGFGDVLDFVGLLPCLAILSLSASVILAAFIFKDPTQGHHSGISLQQVYDALWPKKGTRRDAESHRDVGRGYEQMTSTRSPSF